MPPTAGFPPSAPTALTFDAVTVTFAGVRAVDGVTARVPPGGVTALIGPNGAGKTTLLNCISGINRHTGQIHLGRRPLQGLRPYRRCRAGVARTFQTPALLEEASVLDNVLLGAHTTVRGWAGGRGGRDSEGTLRARALQLLDSFGMVGLAARTVGGLPHADRRRVETARALISRPRLLLLDEPAAGLDDQEAHRLLDVAAANAGTCLLVEHNMQLVMSTARHVVVLAAGAVLASGTPDEVAADPAVIEAYLGDGVLG
jgi:branched-chain amino acid transport system ATP-binding protein